MCCYCRFWDIVFLSILIMKQQHISRTCDKLPLQWLVGSESLSVTDRRWQSRWMVMACNSSKMLLLFWVIMSGKWIWRYFFFKNYFGCAAQSFKIGRKKLFSVFCTHAASLSSCTLPHTMRTIFALTVTDCLGRLSSHQLLTTKLNRDSILKHITQPVREFPQRFGRIQYYTSFKYYKTKQLYYIISFIV